MVRFEELQQLWQNQPQPESAAVAAESRGMAAMLQRFRRRQYCINAIKLVVIVWLAWFLLTRLRLSALKVSGVGLLLAGFISLVIADWRIQSAIARLDFTRPSVGFVDATLERLRDPDVPFRRTGWVGITAVAVGVNLMFVGRIASHAALTLIPFAAFALGMKVRVKRYAMEYKPLVERLAAIRAAMETATGERAQ